MIGLPVVQQLHTFSVLSATDPHPLEVVNANGCSAIVLTCEHAGRMVPHSLGDLGISAEEMDRHIAYDIAATTIDWCGIK